MRQLLPCLRGDELVVDMGAGSGYMALPVARRLDGGRVVCLDLSMEMLKHLRALAAREGLLDRVQLMLSDVCSVGLPDSCADLVVSVSVLHELADPQRAANEMARIAKYGGTVVVADLRPTWLGRKLASHGVGTHGPFSAEQMAFLMARAGLSVVSAEVLRHWLVVVARREVSQAPDAQP
jgi:ubiquinone/menaquinone biosynthesis C-methylase UbiE